MNTISKSQAANLIRNSSGKVFGVSFVKRGDGSIRHMRARIGVSRYVNGQGRNYNPANHDLIGVYEFVTNPFTPRNGKGQFVGDGGLPMERKGYKSIPIDSIYRLKIGGKEYVVR